MTMHQYAGARTSVLDEDEGPTYRELYDEAKERGIEGRSKMTKVELERALAR